MNGWNNHPLSTKNGLSPLQLYTAYAQGSSLFEDEHVDPTTYGIDPNSEVPDDDDQNQTVVVPVVDIPISTSSAQHLQHETPHEYILPSSICTKLRRYTILSSCIHKGLQDRGLHIIV